MGSIPLLSVAADLCLGFAVVVGIPLFLPFIALLLDKVLKASPSP